MNPVYITEQGAVVRQSSKTLVITKDDKKITQIPLLQIDRLLLFGNIQLTTQAINLLLKEWQTARPAYRHRIEKHHPSAGTIRTLFR